jgi:hypothetical protein
MSSRFPPKKQYTVLLRYPKYLSELNEATVVVHVRGCDADEALESARLRVATGDVVNARVPNLSDLECVAIFVGKLTNFKPEGETK